MIITNDMNVLTIIDETADLQNDFTGDADANDTDPARNATVASFFDFLDDAALPLANTIIDVALSGHDGTAGDTGDNVVNVDAGAIGTISSMNLAITGPDGEGTKSGLTTGGTEIFLYTLALSTGEVVIVGRVGTENGVDDIANPNGAIAFLVRLVEVRTNGELSGGKLVTVLYTNLDNPIPGDGTTQDSHDEPTDNLAGLIGVAVEQELSFESTGVEPTQQLFVMLSDEQNANRGIVITGKNPADESKPGITWNAGSTVNTSAADQTVGDKLIKMAVGVDSQQLKAGTGAWYSLISGADPNFAQPAATGGTNRVESNIRYDEAFEADKVEITLTQVVGGTSSKLLVTGIFSTAFEADVNNQTAIAASNFVDILAGDLADVQGDRLQVEDVTAVRVFGVIPAKGKTPPQIVDVSFNLVDPTAPGDPPNESGMTKMGIKATLVNGSVLVEGLRTGFTVVTTFEDDVNRVLYENGGIPGTKGAAAKLQADFDLGGFQVLNTESDLVDVGFSVAFEDDGPDAGVTANTAALELGEVDDTVGDPDLAASGETADGNDDGDEATNLGKTTSTSSLAALFDLTKDAGEDGEASVSDVVELVLIDASAGPAEVSTLATDLDVSDGDDSDPSITLVLATDGLTIWGKIDGNTSQGTDADTAFIISLSGTDAATATLMLEHLLPIAHSETDKYDENQVLTLADASDLVGLKLTRTVTDNDGDTATASDIRDITDEFSFDDDGPSANITDTLVTVTHDETAGVQDGTEAVDTTPLVADDDDQALPVHAVFSGLGTAIGWAESPGAVVTTAGTDFGSDGEKGGGGVVWSLAVGNSGANADSGFLDLDMNKILLNVENGIVIGRVSSDGTDVVTQAEEDDDATGTLTADPIAIAISLDQLGILRVAQYIAIKHGDTSSPDDLETMLDAALVAVLTVTDNDGDESVITENIGDKVIIEDDGGTGSGPAPIDVYEGDLANTQSTGNNDNGNPSPSSDYSVDVDGNVCVKNIDLLAGILPGTDSGALISFDPDSESDLATDNAGLTSQGDAVKFNVTADTITVYVEEDGDPADYDGPATDRRILEVTLVAGIAEVKFYDQFDHDPNDGEGDQLSILLGNALLVTDRDGDPIATGKTDLEVVAHDDEPILAFGNLAGTGTDEEQFGEWSSSVGADEPGVLSVVLDAYFIDGVEGTGVVNVVASMSNGNIVYDYTINDDFTGDGNPENLDFVLTIYDDGTYGFDLDAEFGSSVTFSSENGQLEAGGPTAVRTLVIPMEGGGDENVVFFGVNPETPLGEIKQAIGAGVGDLNAAGIVALNVSLGFLSSETMNVSTAGIGQGNNNVDGYLGPEIDDNAEEDDTPDESFVINPETPLTSMQIFIDNSQPLDFDPPGNKIPDALYYTIYDVNGGHSGPHLVVMDNITMVGNQQTFTIEWDGTNLIDAVQLSMGTGVIKIPVIKFTQQIANLADPLSFDFIATLEDDDTDQAASAFTVVANTDPDPLTEPDFVLIDVDDGDQPDSYNVDVDAGNQWVIEGFDAGVDQLVLIGVDDPLAVDFSGISDIDDDVITVEGTTITIVNGADEILLTDVLIL